jgi:8-oxo-dGTP diphosphatase
MVEVAVAVIERADGAFLLAQRPVGKVYAGWWEFPGGKVHADEDAAAALGRELHEELGIDVRRAYPWITRVHAYQHATVRLHFFRVTGWRGEPHPKEEQAIRWQRLDAPMAAPMLPANAPVLASLALPLEYAITDAQARGVDASLKVMERRLAGGLRMIQVRDRHLRAREDFAKAVVALAHHYGARVLIGGGPAIADGVHYTAAELLSLSARPEGMLAGASCHTPEELDHAMRLEMDFAVLGPVNATASHPGAPLLGWDAFARLARGASIPVYAIGGMTMNDLHTARRAGGHGLAMVRGSWT